MSIHQSTLKNGLRVLSQNMPDTHSVSLGIWVGAGARHEDVSQHGLAHLLEHMAFKGTRKRSSLDIVQEIEAVGGDINAATSLERTAYYIRVLKEDLPLAVDILADISINPVFEEGELSREKGVILSEIGQHLDTPDDVAFDLMRDMAFPGQSIGRNILGNNETINQFEAKDLVSFREKYYVPENMLVAASGNVNHEELVSELEACFDMASSEVSVQHRLPKFIGGEQQEERDVEQAHLVLGFEGVSQKDPDYFTAQILSSLLGGGMSSRLFQQVREKRGLAYSVFSYCWSFSDTGLFGVYAGTNPQDIEEAASVIAAELKNVASTVRGEEIDMARAQIKAGLLMGLESSYVRAERMARQFMTFGREIPIEEIIEKIDQVSVDEIRALSNSLFQANKLSAALVSSPSHSLTKGQIRSAF